MRKLVGILGILVAVLATTPARALELSMGGSFYACVLEGDCPEPLDLWGIGPTRSPLFLGHYQGKVHKRPPIFLGAYRTGQEIYLWHEVTDPSTGSRRSIDIKSPGVYRVGLDPRGGYLIDVRAPAGADSLLKVWVYPARPPSSAVQGASIDPAPRAQGAVGSVVVNGKAPDVAAAGPIVHSPAPPSPPRREEGWGGWQWPVLQLGIAMLLFVSYRRSRQMTLAIAGADGEGVSVAPPLPRAFSPSPAIAAAPEAMAAFSPAPRVDDDLATIAQGAAAPAIMHEEANVQPAPVTREHREVVTRVEAVTHAESVTPQETAMHHEAVTHHEPVTAEAVEAPAPPAAAEPPAQKRSAVHSTTIAPPPNAHFHARAPEGWSPIASEDPSVTPEQAAPPSLPDRGATPYHQPAHPRPTATPAPVPAPAKPANAAPATSSEGLLEALGRRRPHGLPLAALARSQHGQSPSPTFATATVAAVTRALASAFHDVEVVHADDECVVMTALDVQLHRKVSIHALSPALARDERLAAQFVREGQEFAALSHRALLRVHRVAAEPIPHLVADPLPGLPLSASLAAGERMPLHEVLAVGQQLAEALDHLHQRGMVHGDVRPSRMTTGFHCEFRLFPPVFPRMSTERIGNEERRLHRPPEARTTSTGDYRGDIHGLGLVLHQMVTGGPPPRISDSDDEDALHYAAGVPEALTALLRRCLQADPGRRYQDCGVARQTLDALYRDHASREKLVLSCLTGVARVVRAAVHKLHPLLAQVEKLGPAQLAKEIAGPAWREAIQTGLLAQSGMPAIAALLERSVALRKWSQESSLSALLERLGRLAIELAGLATLVDSGGPRHPSVEYRARIELLDLAGEVASFEKSVQQEIASRLVDLHSVVQSLAGIGDGVQVDLTAVPASLRALFADPAVVQRQLIGALENVLAAARTSGARRVTIQGLYEDGYRRVTLVVCDDGRNVLAPIVRPPLPIVPRLTRPAKGYVDAQPRELDAACEPIERLSGRVMVSNRTDAPGVETRISLPSHLC